MKKILFYVLLAAAFTTSCSNDNATISRADENVSTYQDVISKIYGSQAKNHILIQNLKSLNASNRLFSINSSAKEANPFNLMLNGKEITGQNNISSFGNSWINNIDNSALFGKTLRFVPENGRMIINDVSTSKTTDEGSTGITVYFPELIQVGVSGLQNGKVVPGTVITWNVDPNNQNGIVMGVEYTPYEQTELTVREAKPNSDVKYDIVDDSGSYTVTSEDLENFPRDAFLSFYVGRMAYTMGSDGSIVNDTSVGGMTAVRADFQITY